MNLVSFQPSPFSVNVERSIVNSSLQLRFDLLGKCGDLVWPSCKDSSGRGHDLWTSTCFEIFIHQAEGTRYLEWNVSPSGQWDVLGFASYRQPEESLITSTDLAPVHIASRLEAHSAWISYQLPLPLIEEALDTKAWTWQPTAVLATSSGDLSYWAPSHPPSRPDFHLSKGVRHRL